MTEAVEGMRGELNDLLNLLRRRGGGVVCEEFAGPLT